MGHALLVSIAMGALALQSAEGIAQQTPSPRQRFPDQAAGTATRQGAVSLSLPLVRNGRALGDVVAQVDLRGQSVQYERASLLQALAPLLTSDGQSRVNAALPVAASLLTEAELRAAGVSLRYNPGLLQIDVEEIDSSLVPVQSLGTEVGAENPPPTILPERFSTYANITTDFESRDLNRILAPAFTLSSATRFANFVFELDGGYDRIVGDGLYRRRARFVYDQEDKLRRFSAGDLTLESLPLLSGQLLGGIALEKGRRVFNQFSSPITPIGTQQILLQRPGTIEIFSNGVNVGSFPVTAGSYNLARLAGQYSSQNIQVYVVDTSGRRELLGTDLFLDPLDLLPGEDEYSAAIGFPADQFVLEPQYRSNPAFTGFYRRGLTNRLIAGGAVQLSSFLQVAAAEVRLTPRVIPGQFQLSAGASSAGGNGGRRGVSLRGGYVWVDPNPVRGRQVSVSADYESAGFLTLGRFLGLVGLESFRLNASYSQNLSARSSARLGVSWFDIQRASPQESIYAEFVHLFGDRLRATAGVEYAHGSTFSNGFGIRFALSIPFGGRYTAQSSYRSVRDEFRATISRNYENKVGSWGFDAGVSRNQGTTGLDVITNYIGNRFEARGSLFTNGNGFGNIADNGIARLQIGTSIAYTGGVLALGRPVQDSFAIVTSHPTLKGAQVITGRDFRNGRYEASTGAIGAALANNLSPYSQQTLLYDLKGAPSGYDIGSGIETLDPPLHSGYLVRVGSDANVSALGFLTLNDGAQAALTGGTISSIDDAEFKTQPFFTNSVGRFAILGLRPGKTYAVKTFAPEQAFIIHVPADGRSLYDMGKVQLGPAAGGRK